MQIVSRLDQILGTDLKSFNDRRYHELGGRLQPILDSIAAIHEMGFWLEIVTLIVPGFNDSDDELTAIARFVAGISPDIPWHVTAFHQDYKMIGPDNTSAATLIRAANIGREAGANDQVVVYLGGEYETKRGFSTGVVITSPIVDPRAWYAVFFAAAQPNGLCSPSPWCWCSARRWSTP